VEAKHADEDCLKTIAVSVAMFCLTVDWYSSSFVDFWNIQ
jgi:hypothetical protein